MGWDNDVSAETVFRQGWAKWLDKRMETTHDKLGNLSKTYWRCKRAWMAGWQAGEGELDGNEPN